MIQSNLPADWQERWQADFSQATAIQEAVFQPLQAKENLVGISPTGSGKTIAYLLPLLLTLTPKAGSQLLIVTSSQELAIQVTEVAKVWGKDLNLTVAPMIGGANVKRQWEKLKQHPEIIVGTPGRLVELMDSRKLKTHQIKSCVMDEADQLLNQGSKPLLLRLVKHLQKDCQLAFFSATADAALAEIKQLSDHQLKVIDVTKTDTSQGTVDHRYLIWPQRRKIDALRRILNQENQRGLLFFNQLADLGAAEEKLLFHGLPVASLASDQGKLMRKQALNAFREKKLVGLLSTDVAARGLDISGLDLVVNVDLPQNVASYLHRAGRVGRMGRSGKVVTILGEHQVRDYQKLLAETELSGKEIYLHSGKFTEEIPQRQSANSSQIVIKNTKKTKPASENKPIPQRVEPVLSEKKHRQKDRKRKQKDKGKRRK